MGAPGRRRVRAPLCAARAARAAHGIEAHSPLRGVGIKLQGSQIGTGASGFGHARQQSAGAGVGRSVCQAHSGHRCAAVPVLQRRSAARGADAGRAKAVAHGQQHGAAAGTRPAMRGNARIGGSAFTARSGGPGCGAGAASAKRPAARANRSGQGFYAQKITRPPVPAQLWLANGAGTSP